MHFRSLGACLPLAFVATLFQFPATAVALDKQGSAHGGAVGADTGGFGISGAVSLGVSPYNPTYPARPDNSGRVLMRYAGHMDVDLVGRKLSIPLDVNMFTDRLRGGAAKLAPSELDLIGGLTSTWTVGPGAIELGARYEQAIPVDRDGVSQAYVDARARYLYSFAEASPVFRQRFPRTDVNGWLTLGWFAVNSAYFARPDNTGRALLRYALHTELSLFDDLLSLMLDATMFTDRTASNSVRPSELDLTSGLVVHLGAFEAQLAFEIDMPIDRGGFVQRYLYLLGSWSFDLVKGKANP